jgi:hypothetical protein
MAVKARSMQFLGQLLHRQRGAAHTAEPQALPLLYHQAAGLPAGLVGAPAAAAGMHNKQGYD